MRSRPKAPARAIAAQGTGACDRGPRHRRVRSRPKAPARAIAAQGTGACDRGRWSVQGSERGGLSRRPDSRRRDSRRRELARRDPRGRELAPRRDSGSPGARSPTNVRNRTSSQHPSPPARISRSADASLPATGLLRSRRTGGMRARRSPPDFGRDGQGDRGVSRIARYEARVSDEVLTSRASLRGRRQLWPAIDAKAARTELSLRFSAALTRRPATPRGPARRRSARRGRSRRRWPGRPRSG